MPVSLVFTSLLLLSTLFALAVLFVGKPQGRSRDLAQAVVTLQMWISTCVGYLFESYREYDRPLPDGAKALLVRAGKIVFCIAGLSISMHDWEQVFPHGAFGFGRVACAVTVHGLVFFGYVECWRHDATSIHHRVEITTQNHINNQISDQAFKSEKEACLRSAKLIYTDPLALEFVLKEEAKVRGFPGSVA